MNLLFSFSPSLLYFCSVGLDLVEELGESALKLGDLFERELLWGVNKEENRPSGTSTSSFMPVTTLSPWSFLGMGWWGQTS